MRFSSIRRVSVLGAAAMLALATFTTPASAQKKYGPGASDTEIKIGQTMAYSGPASAYGTIGKVEAAYFKMINDQGGINGRKINFISLDDGYSPPKTVEQVRKLVEQEQVLALFQMLGTPSNSAVQKYLNAKKVPHLFLATGASKFDDPKHFPWTMGYTLNYETEGQIYARYLLKNKPNAKIAVLYQNDDFGKDLLKGLKMGLGDKASKMIVAEATYEVTDPNVDSQILTLQASGADTFVNISTPKFAAQAVRKAYDSDWKPLQFLNNVGSSTNLVLKPAGLDKAVGLITVAYYKDPGDARWKDDSAMKDWKAFMTKYYPDGNPNDATNVYGTIAAQLMVQVLKQCGDNLTRENVMKQAASLKNLQLPLVLPGIVVNTSPTDYYVFKQAQLSRFDGHQWDLFGDVIGTTD